MYKIAPMLVVQLNLAESWLQATDTDTLVGVQGTGGEEGVISTNETAISDHPRSYKRAKISYIPV